MFVGDSSTASSREERVMDEAPCAVESAKRPTTADLVFESPKSRQKQKAVRAKAVCPKNVSTRSQGAEKALASREKKIATRSIVAKLNKST
jgi:hypothetical protein